MVLDNAAHRCCSVSVVDRVRMETMAQWKPMARPVRLDVVQWGGVPRSRLDSWPASYCCFAGLSLRLPDKAPPHYCIDFDARSYQLDLLGDGSGGDWVLAIVSSYSGLHWLQNS